MASDTSDRNSAIQQLKRLEALSRRVTAMSSNISRLELNPINVETKQMYDLFCIRLEELYNETQRACYDAYTEGLLLLDLTVFNSVLEDICDRLDHFVSLLLLSASRAADT